MLTQANWYIVQSAKAWHKNSLKDKLWNTALIQLSANSLSAGWLLYSYVISMNISFWE